MMQLKLIRHLWGVTQPWETAFPRYQKLGFSAIETPLPSAETRQPFLELLKQHEFEYVAQATTTGSSSKEHLISLRNAIEDSSAMGAMFLNIHSGSDAWPLPQAIDFYGEAAAMEKQLGLPVAHETHRGRTFFNPWYTRDVLKATPDLKLCCDFSHWCVVAERLLQDCQDIIELAATRAIHIHGRVGYEQGPQVTDPSAPEYREHLESHFRWWTKIWQRQIEDGKTFSTFTPEFGPPGYMHTLPHTQAPVIDLDAVSTWMACEAAARFNAFVQGLGST